MLTDSSRVNPVGRIGAAAGPHAGPLARFGQRLGDPFAHVALPPGPGRTEQGPGRCGWRPWSARRRGIRWPPAAPRTSRTSGRRSPARRLGIGQGAKHPVGEVDQPAPFGHDRAHGLAPSLVASAHTSSTRQRARLSGPARHLTVRGAASSHYLRRKHHLPTKGTNDEGHPRSRASPASAGSASKTHPTPRPRSATCWSRSPRSASRTTSWTGRCGPTGTVTPRDTIIPGQEVSGVVTALGMGTAGIAVGDEVFVLTDPTGTRRPPSTSPSKPVTCAPKPRTVDHVHAASVPRAGLTAWQALFDHGSWPKVRRWSSTARPARSGRPRCSWTAGPAPR